MIQIKHPHLEQFAQEHYEAIKNYIDTKAKIKIETIDSWIHGCFGKEWDFKSLIMANPNELEKLSKIYKIKSCHDFKYFHTLYDYLNNYREKKFFLYDDKKEEKYYRAYELIKKLNISICPYCNRNTIYNLRYSKQRTSELDHFYPQSKYPFFALSFYNLIPSCKVCNKIKLDSNDKEYINPYDDKFDMNKHMKFSLKLKDSTFYHSLDGFRLNCKFDDDIADDEKQRIKNNIKDFKLHDLYQNHKDIVLELIQKNAIYNDSYINELMTQYEGTLFKNREDLLRHITCGYITDEEIGKRPLSKLIKDISQELQLI